MAAEKIKAPKRKSLEPTEQTLKKIKVAKSADRPAPLKSALKGSKATSANKDPVDTLSFDEDEDTLTADQTAALLADFSSSDEDEEKEDEEGIALEKLPPAPISTDALGAEIAKSASLSQDPENTPGVVYIGRLPHGFYERQMRAYFSQFGDITHLRMPRNRKTGRSKHYAFVEFASAAVADIVAKTMDKYLMFNHILRVQRIPQEHVKDGIWKGEGKRKRPMPRNKIEGAQLKRGTDVDGWNKRARRENARRAVKADQLKELGYDFDMPTVKDISATALDTPTLEREAELQLLDDVAHAADVQSNEVGLQPDIDVATTKQKSQQSLGQAEVQASKKRSAKDSQTGKAAKRSKGKK